MMRFEKRFDTPWWCHLLVPLCSIAAALVVSGLFLWLLGIHPLKALDEMIFAAFGDSYGFSETILKTIPLVISATGLVICFRMLVWNIGAEGQIVVGALAAVATVRFFPQGNSIVMIGFMAVMAALAGGLWASIAGFLRAKWNVNEIISTLMLNYVAVNLKNYFVYGPWRDPSSLGFPMTPTFPDVAMLPLLGFGRIHAGLVGGPVSGFTLLVASHLFAMGLRNPRYRRKSESRTICRHERLEDDGHCHVHLWRLVGHGWHDRNHRAATPTSSRFFRSLWQHSHHRGLVGQPQSPGGHSGFVPHGGAARRRRGSANHHGLACGRHPGHPGFYFALCGSR